MTIDVGLFVVVCVLLLIIIQQQRARRPRPRPPMLPPNLKIIWNPYTAAWTWAQQNPHTRFWDWRREATTAEIARWMTDTGEEFPNNLRFNPAEGIAPGEVQL